jgi:hypothetical protein
MLSRADTILLRSFLASVYLQAGDPEPDSRAEEMVQELRFFPARLSTVAEVSRRCELLQYRGGLLGEQAELVRQVLVRLISQRTDADESGESLWSLAFWDRYQRRFKAFETMARREAKILRLLDAVDPAFLFSLYELPEGAGE